MTIYQPSLDYYVYAYLRKDGTPYYIDKGKGERAWRKKEHNQKNSQTQKNKISKGEHPTQKHWHCKKCGKKGRGQSNYIRYHKGCEEFSPHIQHI